ncbi:MAG: T9SS type A sorting domain-containing protein [Ignavibacteriaceae bacterium]|nr:T9SS type A sorting domain-containing protein [Ignavibacteriaceae bacterium]
MTKILHLFFLILFSVPLFAQYVSPWENFPDEVKKSNAFKRSQWFLRQRAYPYDTIQYTFMAQELEKERNRAVDNSVPFMWKSIGPNSIFHTFPYQWGKTAGRGRALAIHPQNSQIILFGAASGSLWKTTNGGADWYNVGQDFLNSTISAIEYDPTNPNIVYVGTGEVTGALQTAAYNGIGLFKSTDGGETFTKATTSFGQYTHISSVQVSPDNPNILLAGLAAGYYFVSNPGNLGVWRSTDAGVTWERVLNFGRGFDVRFDRNVPGRCYAATGGQNANAGFHVSTDYGATWTRSSNGLPTGSNTVGNHIETAKSNPNFIYMVTYEVTGGSTRETRAYKSTDKGVNWTRIGASSILGGTYNGSTWSFQGWYDLAISVNPSNENDVMVGDLELHRYNSASDSFTPLRVSPASGAWNSVAHVDYHGIVFDEASPQKIYVVCDGGIYRTTDNGVTWGDLNNGYNTIQFYRIKSNPNNPVEIWGGAQDNGTYKKAGETMMWEQVSTGDGMEILFPPTDTNYVYYSTQNGYLNRVYRPTMQASGIRPPFSGSVAWLVPWTLHPGNDLTIYGGSDRVYKTTDRGVTWGALSGQMTNGPITSMAISNVNPDYIAVVAANPGFSAQLYLTTDGGLTWSSKSSQLPVTNFLISRVVFHPNDASTIYILYTGFNNEKLFKSTDYGNTWLNVGANLPKIPSNDIFLYPDNPSIIFIANDFGVYMGSEGLNFDRADGNGFPWVPVMDFDYTVKNGKKLLRVGTHGRSAYETDLAMVVLPVELTSFTASVTGDDVLLNWKTASETNNYGFEVQKSKDGVSFVTLGFVKGQGNTSAGAEYSFTDRSAEGKIFYRLKQIDFDGSFSYSNVVGSEIYTIAGYELYQNYPNPFNPVTRISFNMAVAGEAELSVYNSLGEKVSTLLKSNISAGKHSVDFNAEGFSSGVYIYELRTSDLTLRNKMIINK